MDLALTAEQQDLRATARRFLREEITVDRIVADAIRDVPVDRGQWRAMAEMGWMAMATPTSVGGLGAGATDVGVLFEELGRGPAHGPLVESAVLAPNLLAVLAGSPLAAAAAPALADGEAIAVVLLPERPGFPTPAGTSDVRWEAGGPEPRLSGRARFVSDARSATHALVLAPGDRPGAPLLAAWVGFDQPGVDIRTTTGFAPRHHEVELRAVAVPADHHVELDDAAEAAAVEAALRAVPALCSFQVGSCQAVYEMTVAYSRERVQFGRAIGTYQRVQDHVIGLANAMDGARWTTAYALAGLDADPAGPPGAAVHVAKAITAEAHTDACHAAHEVHAGIGSDVKYPLAAHTFRSRALFSTLGSPAWHRARLAGLLGFGPVAVGAP